MASNSSDTDPMAYNPDASIPYWHQRMELAGVIIINSLSLIAIGIRIYLRGFKLKRFRADDKWMVAAGILLIFPLFACQLGTNRYGSGLHDYNIPDSWVKPFWIFSWGWIGYNLVSSLIKISVCCYLLQIVPWHMSILRRSIYALCGLTLSLGIGISLAHMLQCRPLISNFDWNVPQEQCFDIDIPRFTWIGVSLFIDLSILAIPWAIIKETRLQHDEKRVLYIVFAGNLLGTLVLLVSIYTVWKARDGGAYYDMPWNATAFAITNDVEILCYTLGASLPVLSPFLLSRFASKKRRVDATSKVPSWRVKGGSSIPSPSPADVRAPSRAFTPIVNKSMTLLTTFHDNDDEDGPYDRERQASGYSGSTLTNQLAEIHVQFEISHSREKISNMV